MIFGKFQIRNHSAISTQGETVYKNEKILALIPARGGSKGIPRKNIKKLAGKPLINWTIEAALESKYIDKLIVSSDDQEIIDVAKSAGCDAPFVRPASLATDSTPSMDVIMHGLEQMKAISDDSYTHLLLLQPTSPFRTAKHIDDIIENCVDQDAEMTISVNKLSKHPSAMYYLKGRFLTSFIPGQKNTRRQDMPLTLEHNGALYLSKIPTLIKVQSYSYQRAMAFVMEGYSNLDIDEPSDWDFATYLVDKGIVLK